MSDMCENLRVNEKIEEYEFFLLYEINAQG